MIFLLGLTATAQSRIYVSGGLCTSYGGNLTTLFASHNPEWTADLEWERKITGSIYLLAGVSTFGVSYKSEGDAFGAASAYNSRYLAVPVLIRWNMGNKNFLYFDFGLQPYYLVKANLKEHYFKFGDDKIAEGDITAYSNRLFAGAKFQETIAFNRVILSIFIIFPFKGQTQIKNLADHWALNQQQSPYLQSNGYANYAVFGAKIGMRIR